MKNLTFQQKANILKNNKFCDFSDNQFKKLVSSLFESKVEYFEVCYNTLNDNCIIIRLKNNFWIYVYFNHNTQITTVEITIYSLVNSSINTFIGSSGSRLIACTEKLYPYAMYGMYEQITGKKKGQ